jgi:hypothetical protein
MIVVNFPPLHYPVVINYIEFLLVSFICLVNHFAGIIFYISGIVLYYHKIIPSFFNMSSWRDVSHLLYLWIQLFSCLLCYGICIDLYLHFVVTFLRKSFGGLNQVHCSQTCAESLYIQQKEHRN